MAILRRWAALATAVALCGCAQTLSFNECTADGDCAKLGLDPSGQALFCTSDHLCVAGVPKERLCPTADILNPSGKLVIASLVDRGNAVDQDEENAFVLAINEINLQQSGANQPSIALLRCNTASDKDQALRAATLAVETYHATALLGPSTSGALVNLNNYLTTKNVLAISASATAVAITNLQDNDLVWRTVPSDGLQAKVLAGLVKMSVPTPTVIETLYVNSLYGNGLSSQFANQFMVGEVKATWNFPVGAMGADLANPLNNLGKDSPSDALLVADSEAPTLVAMLGTVHGLETTRFYMSDSAKTTDIFKNADPKVLARIRGTAPATPTGQAWMTFKNKYIAQFMKDPSSSPYASYAYDSAYLLAIAAGATTGHIPTGSDFAAGLRKINPNIGTPVNIGSDDYLAALSKIAQGSVNLVGASGPIGFDDKGDPKNGSFDVWSINTSGATPKFVNQ